MSLNGDAVLQAGAPKGDITLRMRLEVLRKLRWVQGAPLRVLDGISVRPYPGYSLWSYNRIHHFMA